MSFEPTSSKRSRAECLVSRSDSQTRRALLQTFTDEELQQLKYDWRFWGRPSQQLPPGDWFVWLLLAGRGFGKNRTAVENIAAMLRGATPLLAPKGAPGLITIVADNGDDLRRFSIMGPSGFLNVGPPAFRPNYSPGYKELRWPNGARALLFSAEDPDSLRGASGDLFWLDELAKYKRAQDCWDNLLLGMREGGNPRGIVTTTPRPIPLIKRLVKEPSTHLTVGSTWENAANLPQRFYEAVIKPLEGTRLGRQEIHAEIIEDLPGALWTWKMIEDARACPTPLPDMARVIVAVDPSGARDQNERSSSQIGIVVAGKGMDGRGYVLADRSCKAAPGVWARRAIDTYHEFRADRIVAERNFGAALVEHTIRMAQRSDEWVSYSEVVASRGKVQRAEPVSTLYEKGLISHVGEGLTQLEDQMREMDASGFMGEGSPDRVDALVWAISELMVSGSSYDCTMAWVG